MNYIRQLHVQRLVEFATEWRIDGRYYDEEHLALSLRPA